MQVVLRTVFVFSFMTFLTVQTATGFVYDLLRVRPKAMVAIDSLVNTVFVAPLGLSGAVIALSALPVVFSFMAFRRAVRLQANSA